MNGFELKYHNFFKLILVLVLCIFIFGSCQQDDSFALMTFNIRYDNPGDGEFAWSKRKESVTGIIHKYNVDILAVQEALKDQVDDLAAALGDHRWIGVGRDDGQEAGEYSAIFYHRKKFDVRDYGNFWLSDTPLAPGSLGWDAACVRIATWARFRERKSGREFIMMNTHLDHIGSVARMESVRLIRERLTELSQGLPVILTGDFNVEDTSKVYNMIVEPGPPFLGDSKTRSVSGHEGPVWTFQGFNRETPLRRIDYIFITEEFQVLRHMNIDDKAFGDYPSDHLPVMIKFSF